MTGRSRTGCLTCRQRKLKCDEGRPVCGQCQKAQRECVPSTGIVFRHQQNASMNSGAAEDSESLKGFYAYKNTFDKDSTWVNIPKKIKFVVNADPYADLEPDFADADAPGLAATNHDSLLDYAPTNDWSPPGALLQPPSVIRPHGLEALSAAASDQLTYLSPMSAAPMSAAPMSAGHHHMREPSAQSSDLMNAMSTSTPHSNHSLLSSPDNGMTQPVRHLGASSTLSPPIDPILDRGSPVIRVASDLAVEKDHETAFLLRHFAEGPGQWMDLFDLGNFFAHYITVKAIANPLLKHAACAYAAKQLSRVKGRKAIMGGSCSRQARMEHFHNLTEKEWEFKGAQHYDKAISLLMEVLKDDKPVNDMDEAMADVASFDEPLFNSKRKVHSESDGLRALLNQTERTNSTASHRKRRKVSKGKAYSDEMAAATAILCNYEFLDGSGAAWSRHLDGTKSLLDIAEGRMVPLLTPFVMPRPNISKARRATFWNFARQDMLSALINETTQTRLDTEDLPMWKDAGLLLDNKGYIMPSNTTETGYPEGPALMKEDMVSNGLVWLIGKIINYCVAADTAPTRVGGAPQPWEGINQHTLMEKWNELQKELQIWSHGLPDTFKPCAEVVARPPSGTFLLGANEGNVFSEVWFASPMCASTMQSYHMARMLLLINMPQHSTLGRTTAYQRMASYKSVAADTEYHSRAICSIAAGRPDASARINSVQPLFLAGQFLEKQVERAEILRMLREIQDDTGWATDYRVKQLMEIWGWDTGSSPADGL